jgi:DNA invertase Pin-like site-specific DNA recombinase
LLLGYARVSTDDQRLDLQRDALTGAGVSADHIYEDKLSGARSDRLGLAAVLKAAREGDTLVVWRLDRLGRTMIDLIKLVTDLEARGVGFRSLTENIDTTTPAGKLIFHVFGALAEFERNLTRERTRAGLMAARARGRVGGRKRAMSDRDVVVAKTLLREGSLTVEEVAEQTGVSMATLYRSRRRGGEDPAPGREPHCRGSRRADWRVDGDAVSVPAWRQGWGAGRLISRWRATC